MLLVNFYSKAEDANLEKRSITTFLETNDPEYRLVKKYSNKKYNKADVIHYIALLYIPKINLKQGLVSQSSPLNNVDSNIEILSPSKMPNEKNSTLVLASHSGNSKVSYFDKIDELTYGDLIYIYYQKKKYTYKITTFYEEPKQGFISIKYYNKK